MPKPAKKSGKPHTTRKRLTSERALKLRPQEPLDAAKDFETPTKKDPEEVKKPRQACLPQMEDPAIEELEGAAEDYAEIRDKRQALTLDEVRLKTELLNLMHSHSKTEYNHGGVSIKVIVESEKVKVRIKKDEEDGTHASL